MLRGHLARRGFGDIEVGGAASVRRAGRPTPPPHCSVAACRATLPGDPVSRSLVAADPWRKLRHSRIPVVGFGSGNARRDNSAERKSRSRNTRSHRAFGRFPTPCGQIWIEQRRERLSSASSGTHLSVGLRHLVRLGLKRSPNSSASAPAPPGWSPRSTAGGQRTRALIGPYSDRFGRSALCRRRA